MIGSILSKLFCGLLPFGFQWSEVSIWVILIAGGGGVLAPRSCRGLLLGAGLRLASEESVEVLLPRHLVVAGQGGGVRLQDADVPGYRHALE